MKRAGEELLNSLSGELDEIRQVIESKEPVPEPDFPPAGELRKKDERWQRWQ